MHCPEKCRLVVSFVYQFLSEMLPKRSSCGPDFLTERNYCGVNFQPQRSSCASSRKKLPACRCIKKFLRVHNFWAIL